ncbi:MAG: hypothetical protein M3R54_08220 [Chloroflexota bacterium]|nr:hypothetical protein [Chloroflexota bacterium]
MAARSAATQLETLLSLQQDLALETEIDRVLARIVETATEMLDAERATLFVIDSAKNDYEEPEAIVAVVEDDGKGFDIAAVLASYATRGSLGLLQMREAARLIGAQLSIDLSVGNGTRIRLVFPS